VTSISGNTLTSGQVTTALGFTPGTAYSLPTATTSVLGGVKVDGSTITINGSGVIMANYTTYSLPTATTTVLGGVKVDGSTITINGSGVISSAASSIPTYPAITRLDVTNNGASAYLFNNQYSGNNPTIYAISGTTIAFNLNVLGHPFLIRQSGANFDTGLIHVSTTGTVSTGTSAQGQTSGTLYWQIPQASAGAFAYQCSIHGGMVGVITVKQISSLP
jgi:plastocyanin